MNSLVALVVQRSWVALSGLMTTVLITFFLSQQMQGWYYAFLSLAAVYSLFDLGLSTILVNVAAQVGHQLKWKPGGELQGGDIDRFRSLLLQSARIYLGLAIGFVLLMIPAGIVFFVAQAHADDLAMSSWFGQWVALALVTTVMLALMPFLAIIEGTGKVAEVVMVRLIYGVMGSLACWLVLWAGGGLWAAVMIPGTSVVVMVLWMSWRYPALLASVRKSLRNPAKNTPRQAVNWRQEIWPMQWRFGLGWTASYLLTQIYTPILFYFSGSSVAGQMGLSFSIANMLAVIAHSWISRHVPAMTQAATSRDWTALDHMFKRDLLLSTGFFIGGAGVLCVMHLMLQPTQYGERILPLWPFTGLLTVALVNHLTGTLAAQLRAFQREPLVWVTVPGALLIVPSAIWIAPRHGAGGVIGVILAVQLAFVLPAVIALWRHYQHQLRT